MVGVLSYSFMITFGLSCYKELATGRGLLRVTILRLTSTVHQPTYKKPHFSVYPFRHRAYTPPPRFSAAAGNKQILTAILQPQILSSLQESSRVKQQSSKHLWFRGLIGRTFGRNQNRGQNPRACQRTAGRPYHKHKLLHSFLLRSPESNRLIHCRIYPATVVGAAATGNHN